MGKNTPTTSSTGECALSFLTTDFSSDQQVKLHPNRKHMNHTILLVFCSTCTALVAAGPSFTIDAGRPAGNVSPRLYGLMTEEINHSYDGGLYAELIRNRAFLDDARSPDSGVPGTGNPWSVGSQRGFRLQRRPTLCRYILK